MKNSTHSSVHLTMGLRVGTTVRVDALLSVQKRGGGPERISIREVSQDTDARGEGCAFVVISLVEKVMTRVGAELKSRDCEVTALKLESMFRDQVPPTDSLVEKIYGVVDWVGEIQHHFFTESTSDQTDATIAGNSNSSNS
jgi:hypothetical protein